MAQKIEFITAGSLDDLGERFNAFVESFHDDARFIITPIGFVKDGGRFVFAVRVEASHKTTFVEPECNHPVASRKEADSGAIFCTACKADITPHDDSYVSNKGTEKDEA